MNDLRTYTDRLAHAMKLAGFDARRLAEAAGFSYQAAKKAQDGITNMLTAENNVKVAHAMGVSSEWLATGEGHPTEKAWPFSPELLAACRRAQPAERWKAENAARVVLDLPTMPMPETFAASA